MSRPLLLLASLALAGCSETALNSRGEPIDEPDPVDEPDGGVDSAIPDGVATGGVHGLVCATPRMGLQGAVVEVEHAYGIARTATDVEGRFRLDDLPTGEHVLVIRHPDHSEQVVVDIPPDGLAWARTANCEDPCEHAAPCVGLAEAYDRGWAEIEYSSNGTLDITNIGPGNGICLDPWAVVTSVFSQDAVIGTLDGTRIEPGETFEAPYGVDVFGGAGLDAWWCVERDQVTRAGSLYDYNGSLSPRMIDDFVVRRTDTNGNEVEDHSDYVEGQLQSQHNIWNAQRNEPIVIIGRDRNVVRLTDEASSVVVTLQARNLGHQDATAIVAEVVPEGFEVLDTVPLARVQPLVDGSTLLEWTVDVDGAIPVPDGQAIYDQVEVSYRLARGDTDCEGRCMGRGAVSTWRDLYGRAWHADSEPLVIEVCE